MANHKRDVLITGMGVISPVGLTVSDFRDSLLCNRSGIRLWESPANVEADSGGRNRSRFQ